MTKELLSRVGWLIEDTESNYNVRGINNACRVYPSIREYVIILHGELEGGGWFARTWFRDQNPQPIVVYTSLEELNRYVQDMLDIA